MDKKEDPKKTTDAKKGNDDANKSHEGPVKDNTKKPKDAKASGTSIGYVPRECPKEPYIKPCYPPIDVCEGTKEKNELCPKKKEKGLTIDDSVEVVKRPKPPKCPPPVNPCAQDKKPAEAKAPEPETYTCKPKKDKDNDKDPCATDDN